jgi:hypothetical protein
VERLRISTASKAAPSMFTWGVGSRFEFVPFFFFIGAKASREKNSLSIVHPRPQNLSSLSLSRSSNTSITLRWLKDRNILQWNTKVLWPPSQAGDKDVLEYAETADSEEKPSIRTQSRGRDEEDDPEETERKECDSSRHVGGNLNISLP